MGLIDNTKNIELAISEKNKQDKQKQIEKRKKQEEAANLQRLKNDIIREIKTEFDEAIRNKEDIQKYYFNEKYYTLLNNIIREYGKAKNIIDYVTGEQKTKYINQYEIKDIFDNNYFKILKQKENICKKQKKIIQEQEQEKAKQQQTQEQTQKTNCNNILKICGIVAAAPVVIIGAALFGAIKASK